MPRRLKFGLHDFLNAQPILGALRARETEAGLQVVTDTPAALADRLNAGELDLAMIPSVEYFRAADRLRLVPGLCIASRGEVKTVLLLCRKPLHAVRSLGVDARSRTSAALLQILFRDQLPPDAAYHPVPPDPAQALEQHDAALIIGDQALTWPRDGTTRIVDLSQAWFEQTGKTFVHAVVASREGVRPDPKTLALLNRAGEDGLAQMDLIVKDFIKTTGLDAAVCEDYLRHRIRFTLGEAEQDGLRHFQHLCHTHRLIPEKHPFVFL